MYFKLKYSVMGLVEKTQDSRENPRGLLDGRMHGVYISICQQRGGGETPPSAHGFQEKVKHFLLHARRSLSVCTCGEAGGRKGEGREKEKELLTIKAKQIETIVSPFPGGTVRQISMNLDGRTIKVARVVFI